MATHASIPSWRIPQTEEPGGLQSMGSQRVGYTEVTQHSIQMNVKQYSYVHCYLGCKYLFALFFPQWNKRVGVGRKGFLSGPQKLKLCVAFTPLPVLCDSFHSHIYEYYPPQGAQGRQLVAWPQGDKSTLNSREVMEQIC